MRCFYFSSKYLKFGDNGLQIEFLFLEDRKYLRFFWISFNTPLSEDISKELSGSDSEHAFCWVKLISIFVHGVETFFQMSNVVRSDQ